MMSFSIADATVKTPYIDHILAIVRAKDVVDSVRGAAELERVLCY